MLSLHTVLTCLLNMLGRDIHRKILFKESLEDFVTCMPAYLPPGALRSEAKELVEVTRSKDYQLQPPRLINLAKAKLAKLYFGLEKVLTTSVGDLVILVIIVFFNNNYIHS